MPNEDIDYHYSDGSVVVAGHRPYTVLLEVRTVSCNYIKGVIISRSTHSFCGSYRPTNPPSWEVSDLGG